MDGDEVNVIKEGSRLTARGNNSIQINTEIRAKCIVFIKPVMDDNDEECLYDSCE